MKRFIDWDKIIYTCLKGLLFALIAVCFFTTILPEIPGEVIWIILVSAFFVWDYFKDCPRYRDNDK